MAPLECPACDGTGSVQGDDGATVIGARCDGRGILFVDADVGAALGDAGG